MVPKTQQHKPQSWMGGQKLRVLELPAGTQNPVGLLQALQMVTAAMKLKDACSLEEKL